MRVPPSHQAISFIPFRGEWRGYGASSFFNDLYAAFSVALMTIPQSIAYSLLAGLPPTAGLFSAIFGTIFTAVFGSSRYLIAGPSTGTAILIQTSISSVLYTYFGQVTAAQKALLTLHILTQIVVLMGIIQIAAAFFNVSKLLQFVSRPVVLGYFAGITVAVAVVQLFALTGIASPGGDQSILFRGWYLLVHLSEIHPVTFLLGIFSMGFLLLMRRWFKSWPNALTMLILASFAALLLNLWLGSETVATLNRLNLPKEPLPELTLPLLDFHLLNKVFPAAVAIAFLAILEVFSISRTFAAKSGERVLANQDVFGLGIGNAALSLLWGALPTSGSATRTLLNFRLRSKSRLSAIFSGLFTAIVTLFCWPLVQQIPLTALAALLIATVPMLMDWKEIRLSFRATREDAWVFLITFSSCLIFRLDIAFFIGILISIGTYLKKSATPHLVEYAFNTKGRLAIVQPTEDVQRKVRIIGIGGDLYFATADLFQEALQSVAEDPNVQVIVLRLNNVHHMDASMCLALLHLFERLRTSDRHLIVSGLTEEVWQVFHRAGLVKQIGLDNLYFTDESNPQFSTWKAALRAQELIHGHRG